MPVKTILIVDDSPTERFVLSELLTRNDYQVLTAENGEEGVDKARKRQPDLIVMDVVMPGVNGYQATRMLTRDEATRHIPVIVCTSKGQETDRIWGLRQGAVDYVVKPVKAEDLLSKIAAL
jgi:twitching motility two-component system response regulator PilH